MSPIIHSGGNNQIRFFKGTVVFFLLPLPNSGSIKRCETYKKLYNVSILSEDLQNKF